MFHLEKRANFAIVLILLFLAAFFSIYLVKSPDLKSPKITGQVVYPQDSGGGGGSIVRCPDLNGDNYVDTLDFQIFFWDLPAGGGSAFGGKARDDFDERERSVAEFLRRKRRDANESVNPRLAL